MSNFIFDELNAIDATQDADFSGDIDQDTQEQYLLSDSMDAALDRWVDGTFALEAEVSQ